MKEEEVKKWLEKQEEAIPAAIRIVKEQLRREAFEAALDYHRNLDVTANIQTVLKTAESIEKYYESKRTKIS